MRIYECQNCANQGNDREQFKIIKYKNIGIVYCVPCAEEWEKNQ